MNNKITYTFVLLALLCAILSFAASSAEKIVDKNPFLYSGYYVDKESDNGYLKARYMDPALKTFLTWDTYPVTNRYGYCDGNPVEYSDSKGHMREMNPLLMKYSFYKGNSYSVDKDIPGREGYVRINRPFKYGAVLLVTDMPFFLHSLFMDIKEHLSFNSEEDPRYNTRIIEIMQDYVLKRIQTKKVDAINWVRTFNEYISRRNIAISDSAVDGCMEVNNFYIMNNFELLLIDDIKNIDVERMNEDFRRDHINMINLYPSGVVKSERVPVPLPLAFMDETFSRKELITTMHAYFPENSECSKKLPPEFSVKNFF